LAKICAKIGSNDRFREEHPENSMTTVWQSLSLLLHLTANALWLGGIVFFLVVAGPAVQELDAKIAIKTMNRCRIGLELVSWTAIVLLLLTGITNLILRSPSAAPGESYLVLLGVKLFFFGAMATHHGLQVFKYSPRIAALTAELPANVTSWPEPLIEHWRRWFLLLKINAGLGPIAVLLGLAIVKG
jgi:putative copper export protein